MIHIYCVEVKVIFKGLDNSDIKTQYQSYISPLKFDTVTINPNTIVNYLASLNGPVVPN